MLWDDVPRPLLRETRMTMSATTTSATTNPIWDLLDHVGGGTADPAGLYARQRGPREGRRGP